MLYTCQVVTSYSNYTAHFEKSNYRKVTILCNSTAYMSLSESYTPYCAKKEVLSQQTIDFYASVWYNIVNIFVSEAL